MSARVQPRRFKSLIARQSARGSMLACTTVRSWSARRLRLGLMLSSKVCEQLTLPLHLRLVAAVHFPEPIGLVPETRPVEGGVIAVADCGVGQPLTLMVVMAPADRRVVTDSSCAGQHVLDLQRVVG